MLEAYFSLFKEICSLTAVQFDDTNFLIFAHDFLFHLAALYLGAQRASLISIGLI
jgi:hypothetical protein